MGLYGAATHQLADHEPPDGEVHVSGLPVIGRLDILGGLLVTAGVTALVMGAHPRVRAISGPTPSHTAHPVGCQVYWYSGTVNPASNVTVPEPVRRQPLLS